MKYIRLGENSGQIYLLKNKKEFLYSLQYCDVYLLSITIAVVVPVRSSIFIFNKLSIAKCF